MSGSSSASGIFRRGSRCRRQCDKLELVVGIEDFNPRLVNLQVVDLSAETLCD